MPFDFRIVKMKDGQYGIHQVITNQEGEVEKWFSETVDLYGSDETELRKMIHAISFAVEKRVLIEESIEDKKMLPLVPLKASSELERVRGAEDEVYQNANKVLGETFSLAQDMVSLYQLLAEMLKTSGVESKDEIAVGVQFLLACRYQLTVGILALLRGHVSDSYFYTRRAIEFCAFAVRIKRHPHLAMEWLNAGNDERSYERYRDKFSSRKLFFTEDQESLKQLRERYDFSSKFVHSSPYSVARLLKTEETSTGYGVVARIGRRGRLLGERSS